MSRAEKWVKDFQAAQAEAPRFESESIGAVLRMGDEGLPWLHVFSRAILDGMPLAPVGRFRVSPGDISAEDLVAAGRWLVEMFGDGSKGGWRVNWSIPVEAADRAAGILCESRHHSGTPCKKPAGHDLDHEGAWRVTWLTSDGATRFVKSDGGSEIR